MSGADPNSGRNQPFPIGGVPTNPELWADRAKVLERLKNSFESVIASREILLIQVVGDYGSGKTQTLWHFKYLMENGKEGFDKVRILPVYLDSPGEDYQDFYNRFLSSLKLETIVSSLRALQASIMVTRTERVRKAVAAGKAEDEQIKSILDQDNVFDEVRKSLLEIFGGLTPLRGGGPIPDFWNHLATALTGLLKSEDEKFAATKWLTFGKLYSTDLRLLRVQKYDPSPSYIAHSVAGLLRLVAVQAKYDNVTLFIDEMETMTSADDQTKDDFARCLRELFDSGFPGLIVVFGSSTEAQRIFTQSTAAALLQRIATKVELAALSPAEAVTFVDDYVKETLGKKGSDFFEDGAVKEFSDAARGNVRMLVRLLREGYNAVITDGGKPLSVEKAKEVVSSAKARNMIS